MGQEIPLKAYTQADFQRYQDRLAAETSHLIAFARRGGFNDGRYVAGFELEAWLLDHASFPNPINEAFLRALDDPMVIPELSRFNVELNGSPMEMVPGVLHRMEASLGSTWKRCQDQAHDMDAVLAMIGILPTIRNDDLCLKNISAMNRYGMLNEQVQSQRGGAPIHIDIEGTDHLLESRSDVMMEAATTSFQIHMQMPFALGARYYNASLISCGPLLAAATNSPLLFGRSLWAETRIPLFEQSVEIGGYGGLGNSRVRRVDFGLGFVERDLTELFQENLDLYPVLLPTWQDSPVGSYAHVRLHNGAIWRWVRPLIGFDEHGQAHMRLEQRILPSGPTLQDMVANAGLYFGLVHALAQGERPAEMDLSFENARSNFYEAAKNGLSGRLRWLDGRIHPAKSLLLDSCIPLARQGLLDLGLGGDEIDHYLEIIMSRTRSGQTGSEWQLRHLANLNGDIPRLMEDYLENQRAGMPVHEWDI